MSGDVTLEGGRHERRQLVRNTADREIPLDAGHIRVEGDLPSSQVDDHDQVSSSLDKQYATTGKVVRSHRMLGELGNDSRNLAPHCAINQPST